MSQKLAKLIFEKAAQSKAMPQTIHPIFAGNHLPAEHLIYASDREAQMLRSQTDGKSDTTQWGPESFTDPSQSYGHTLSSSFSGNSGPTGGLGSNYSSNSSYNTPSSPSASIRSSSGPTGGLGSNYSAGSSYNTSSPSSSANTSGGGGSASAMQGGFGAQAFGNSTASAAAIHSAVNSGGYNAATGGGGSNVTFRDLNGIANTLGQRMQGGAGQVAFGGAPIGSYTVRQQTQPQPTVAIFASPQVTPQRHNDFVSLDSVGNIPYSGPHTRPVTAPTSDTAVSSATYSGPHTRPQLETAFADASAPNPRNYGSFPPQDMAAGLDPDHKQVYALANRYPNMNAHDIMRMASLESAQTMNPSVMGGAGNKYRGVFQFGPSEQKQYGIGAGSTIGDQANALGNFFDDRGLSRNANIGDAYTVINHGSGTFANNGWRIDNNGTGTIADKVAQLRDPNSIYSKQADLWLGSNTAPIQVASAARPQVASATSDAPIDQSTVSPFNNIRAGSPEYVAARDQATTDGANSFPAQVASIAGKTPIGAAALGIGGLIDNNLGGGFYGNSGNSGNSDGGVRLAGFANNGGDNGSKSAIINSAIDAALNHNKTPPAVIPPVASQGPIGPAYSIATAQGNYIVDSHGQYFMLDRTGAYMPVAPPRGAVA